MALALNVVAVIGFLRDEMTEETHVGTGPLQFTFHATVQKLYWQHFTFSHTQSRRLNRGRSLPELGKLFLSTITCLADGHFCLLSGAGGRRCPIGKHRAASK